MTQIRSGVVSVCGALGFSVETVLGQGDSMLGDPALRGHSLFKELKEPA